MKHYSQKKIKSSLSLIVLCFVFFTTSCKKNMELSTENVDISSRLKMMGNLPGNGFLLDSNVQLKLGLLDTVLVNRIHNLSVTEQKLFWNIVADIEVANLDILYYGFTRVNTRELQYYPYPMVDTLSIIDPGAGELGYFDTGLSSYARIPNPHYTSFARQVRNIGDLINLIPFVSQYIDLVYNKITYSVGYVPGSDPYFSIALFSSDVFHEEQDQLYVEPIEVEEVERPQYTLTDEQKANYQSAYDTLPDAIKKLWPWYPYPNRRK